MFGRFKFLSNLIALLVIVVLLCNYDSVLLSWKFFIREKDVEEISEDNR